MKTKLNILAIVILIICLGFTIEFFKMIYRLMDDSLLSIGLTLLYVAIIIVLILPFGDRLGDTWHNNNKE